MSVATSVVGAFADMALALDDVRSRGRSGSYLLFMSISPFDPQRTSGSCSGLDHFSIASQSAKAVVA
jgi:hypothetical protein